MAFAAPAVALASGGFVVFNVFKEKMRILGVSRLRMFFILAAGVLFIAACSPILLFLNVPDEMIAKASLADAPYEDAKLVGNISNPQVKEPSGLARSQRREGVMWTHGDSGNDEVIYAIGINGEVYGSFKINGVTLDDWEDIASYTIDGVPYLLIADIGDNVQEDPFQVLHAVIEPEKVTNTAPATIDVAWSMRYRYEDGPRDAEAMAVDSTTGEILIFTKRDLPHRLYTLPLPGGQSDITETPAVAKFVTEVRTVPQPVFADVFWNYPRGSLFGMVTAFDILDDGSRAVVLNYDDVLVYQRAPNEGWGEALNNPPTIKAVSVTAEAVGFIPYSKSFVVVPEKWGKPVYFYEAK